MDEVPDSSKSKKSHRNKEKSAHSNIEIREMQLEDLPTVFSLGEKLFTAEKWPNLYRTWDEYELVYMFSTDGEYCLVAELDNKIAGFALGSLIEKRRSAWAYGYVQWLGVDPDIKRTGIGTKLLSELTDIFIENGARMMLVDTEVENEEAIHFFKKQGFGNEVEHLYLSRNLTTHPDYLRKKAKESRGKSTRPAKSHEADISISGIKTPNNGDN